ncbi:hypothetical protein GCM10028806_42800 [Spirosoma terrae]|jgi:hypothetical protein|uniref:T9SS type A sorting domain-containing protein n=1 Tax=Spirosoma terrae TaxID=1968276 RepID=A0A6L9L0M3_9BACT|nr:T9SS type A sorting domain-containing protein [Spirosoma terrae]NDU94054.1 T9SS type A sorting domain-containing protein [Spirosoma terrae]
MKTSIKVLASAFAFFVSVSVSSFGFAQGDQPEQKGFALAMFPSSQPSKVWLCLEKYKADNKISVQLVDENGQVMFQEALPTKGGKRNGYRQQFDLSDIKDGKYTFRITDGNQIEERTFKLSTPNIEQQLPARHISMN